MSQYHKICHTASYDTFPQPTVTCPRSVCTDDLLGSRKSGVISLLEHWVNTRLQLAVVVGRQKGQIIKTNIIVNLYIYSSLKYHNINNLYLVYKKQFWMFLDNFHIVQFFKPKTISSNYAPNHKSWQNKECSKFSDFTKNINSVTEIERL